DGLAHTLVDVVGTLDAERGDGAAAELLVWSRAVAATVQSHARDMDTLLPWARHAGEDDGDHRLLATVPAPVEMSDRCAAALAEGDVPASHWFQLGRAMTPVDRGSALVSWSGSMFEYLMPALVMRSPPGSLLEQTYRFVVRRHVRYGATRGVPWGVSESAFNA